MVFFLGYALYLAMNVVTYCQICFRLIRNDMYYVVYVTSHLICVFLVIS